MPNPTDTPEPTDNNVGGEELALFLAVAHRLGVDASRRHLDLWGVARFSELSTRGARNSLILAMIKELFNDQPD